MLEEKEAIFFSNSFGDMVNGDDDMDSSWLKWEYVRPRLFVAK